MTYQQFARIYNPEITDEEIHYLLWEWTAYPIADLKYTVKQFLSALRMHKNKRSLCWECGLPIELGHRKKCSLVNN